IQMTAHEGKAARIVQPPHDHRNHAGLSGSTYVSSQHHAAQNGNRSRGDNRRRTQEPHISPRLLLITLVLPKPRPRFKAWPTMRRDPYKIQPAAEFAIACDRSRHSADRPISGLLPMARGTHLGSAALVADQAQGARADSFTFASVSDQRVTLILRGS